MNKAKASIARIPLEGLKHIASRIGNAGRDGFNRQNPA